MEKVVSDTFMNEPEWLHGSLSSSGGTHGNLDTTTANLVDRTEFNTPNFGKIFTVCGT